LGLQKKKQTKRFPRAEPGQVTFLCRGVFGGDLVPASASRGGPQRVEEKKKKPTNQPKSNPTKVPSRQGLRAAFLPLHPDPPRLCRRIGRPPPTRSTLSLPSGYSSPEQATVELYQIRCRFAKMAKIIRLGL